MSSGIIAIMIGVSTFLGALGLIALLWGVKTGQFDDENKFLNGAHFDSEEELNDAIKLEKRRKKAKEREKNYRPPD
jgi:cbb3-type cytochrome oxidase maturation protein